MKPSVFLGVLKLLLSGEELTAAEWEQILMSCDSSLQENVRFERKGTGLEFNILAGLFIRIKFGRFRPFSHLLIGKHPYCLVDAGHLKTKPQMSENSVAFYGRHLHRKSILLFSSVHYYVEKCIFREACKWWLLNENNIICTFVQ